MKLNKKIRYIILPIVFILSTSVSTIYYMAYKERIIENQIASLDGRVDNLLLRSEYLFEYSKDYLRQKIDSKEGLLIFNTVEKNIPLPASYITQFLNRFINTNYNRKRIVNDVAIFSRDYQLVVHINTQDPFSEPVLKERTKGILKKSSVHKYQKISQYYYFIEKLQQDKPMKVYIVQIFSPYLLTSTAIYDINDSLYLMQAEINTDYVSKKLAALIAEYQGHLTYRIEPKESITDTLKFTSQGFASNERGFYSGSVGTNLFDINFSLDETYFEEELNSVLSGVILLNILLIVLNYLILLWLINRQIILPITALSRSIKATEGSSVLELQPLQSKDEVADLNESYISLIQKINKLANNDPLTGLANRASFNKQLTTLTEKFADDNTYTAIFYIDLDNFKYVNDNFGHKMGDRLLLVFSQRLKQQIRTPARGNFTITDCNTCIARIGGDEFVIVINTLPSLKVIESIGQRICDLFINGFVIDQYTFDVHASIGIAYSNNKIENAETLLNQADYAMYLAKDDGKNNFKLYSEEVNEKIEFEKNIERMLFDALKHNHFLLLFMPAYCTSTLKLMGYELLIRSPELSDLNIGPDAFVPIAEKTDLILRIDMWVAEQAVRLLKDMTESTRFKGFFSINVSAKSLRDDRFYKHLKKLIEVHQIDESQLELEITETCLLPDDNKAIYSLKQLKSLGVSIALDDFGTGYTSFSQLVNYPLDTLKIDRSFIKEIHNRRPGKKPTLNIIFELAQVYQLNVIVEGIETKEDFQYVKALGCDAVQGYFFTKPMTLDSVLTTYELLGKV